MNEHKVSEVRVYTKQGNTLKARIIPKSTDIEIMGHYAGKGYVKEVRLGLPAGSFSKGK